MVIFRKFIFIHIPKTGGNFVGEVLHKLYRQQMPTFSPRRFLRWVVFWFWEWHGGYRHMPPDCQWVLPAGKKLPAARYFRGRYFLILSNDNQWVHSGIHNLPGLFLRFFRGLFLFSVRDIYAQHVSMWAFNRAAAKRYNDYLPSFLPRYPDLQLLYKERFGDKPYYELTFREGVQFLDSIKFRAWHRRYFPGLACRHDIGFISLQLIYFLFPDPQSIVELSETEFADFFRNGGYREWFKRVRFVHTEHLNGDLRRFLLEVGYPEKQVQFVLSKIPVNTTKKPKLNPYDAELWNHVYRKNWIFFEMFPEYRLTALRWRERILADRQPVLTTAGSGR